MAFNLRCCDDSEHSLVNQRREPAMRIRPLHHILRAWVSGCAAGASIFLSLAKKDCTLLCEMDCAEPGVDFGGAYWLKKPAGRGKPCLLFKVALRDGNETRTNCLTFKNCLDASWEKFKYASRRSAFGYALVRFPQTITSAAKSIFSCSGAVTCYITWCFCFQATPVHSYISYWWSYWTNTYTWFKLKGFPSTVMKT